MNFWMLKEYRRLFVNRDYLLLSSSVFFFSFAFYFFTWYVPILIMDLYGPFHLGFVYALSTAVSVLAVFSGFIADVIGYKPIILVVPILIMFSFILFFTGDTSLWILLIVAVALHIPPLAGPAISALISNLVSSETLGMAFSFYRFLMLAGFTASSSALAFLTQYFGLKPVLALSIISLGICALLRFFIRSARPYTGIPTQRSGPRILDIIRSFKKYELFAIISFSTVNALALSYGPYLYNFIRDVIGLSILYMGLYESVTTIAPSLFQPVSGLIIDKFGCIATLKYALILESLIVSVISLLAYMKVG